jgi:hypothetical protein
MFIEVVALHGLTKREQMLITPNTDQHQWTACARNTAFPWQPDTRQVNQPEAQPASAVMMAAGRASGHPSPNEPLHPTPCRALLCTTYHAQVSLLPREARRG